MKSVLCQTYPNIEYLIIDGASTDGTVEMVKKHFKNEKLLFFSEKDFGIYNAMNRGIARASGDFIYFINAGDRFYNESVVADVISLITNRDAIYYGNICLVYSDGLKQIQDFSKINGSIEQKLNAGNMPCHQSIFSPRKLLVDHYFREKYKIRADYEWLLYTVKKGYECIHIPTIISYYDVSGVSARLKNGRLFSQESGEILQEYQDEISENKELCFFNVQSEQEKAAQKYTNLFFLVCKWLALEQKKCSILESLKRKKYNHIAIYGMSHMGLRLLEETKKYNIVVDYAIDRNVKGLDLDIKIVFPEEELEEVDAIIVTAIDSFYEIESVLKKKVICPVISLEDMIYEAEMDFK